ncbi:MAG: pilus assembly protein [Pseudomonadota bacterium]|nr:pilus assembly protein [Pseudomonadota bacterium]
MSPRRCQTRPVSRRRGSYAIEFAFVLPIFVALGGGVLDWGWYFSQEYKVQTAAKVCARTGVATDQAEDPEGTAEAAGSAALTEQGISGTTATLVATPVGATPEEMLTCDVTVPFTALVGLVPTLPSLRAVVTMRMEDQP